MYIFLLVLGGGQDKPAWTASPPPPPPPPGGEDNQGGGQDIPGAYPPPLQLSIQNNPTKKAAEFYLNYV